MKFIFILIFFYVFEIAASKKIINSGIVFNGTKHEYSSLLYFETLKEDLVNKIWAKDEEPCLDLMVKIIRNVQNSTLWATWIWDSMQMPMGQLYGTKIHLGNYDQCLDLPWKDNPEFRTQYCIAEVRLTETDGGVKDIDLLGPVQSYIKLETKHGLKFNDFTLGVCIPAVCKPKSVTKFVEVLIRNSHLGQMGSPEVVSVNSEFCQVAGDRIQRTSEYYFVWSFIIFLTMLTIFCTCYTAYRGETSKSTVGDLIRAFDIQTNAQSLWKTTDDHISSLLGIRIVSVIVTTGSHFSLIKILFGIHNAGKLNQMYDTTNMTMLFNLEMIIDTFIMISGLLLINGLMDKGVRPFSPLKVIMKRYIRFIWPIILILMVLPYVFTPENPGPLTRLFFKTDVESCTNDWWRIILMISNYSNLEKMCYPILWSVPCDFHLSVIGIFIYWVYVKNKRAGIQVFTLSAIASFLVPFIYAYTHNKPAVNAFNLRTISNYRKHIMANPAYTMTHLRAGAYFVGMAIGFFLAAFKPAKYRNVISKKWSILAFSVFLVLFTILNIIAHLYQGHEGSPLENALFSVLRRILWAALIGFLIIICEYGTLPFIPDLLGWSTLVPLSKLSYGTYLTHFMILMRLIAESRVPHRQDMFEDTIVAFGLTAVSTAVSLFMWIFLEAPIINLLFMMFDRSKNTHQKGQVETIKQHYENGHNESELKSKNKKSL